jgi:hypothetical protein
MSAATQAASVEGAESSARDTTLLDLVRAIGSVTDDDREVVATVLHMLRSGRVRLCGNFSGSSADDMA